MKGKKERKGGRKERREEGRRKGREGKEGKRGRKEGIGAGFYISSKELHHLVYKICHILSSRFTVLT